MGYREIPVGTETCLACNTAVEEGTALCTACGAPIDVAQFAELELKLKPLVRQARTALWVAMMLFATCFLLLFSLEAPSSTLATAAFGTLLFGGCCLLSARWPLAASVTALSIFSALQLAVIAQGRLWMLFQGSVVVALKVILFVLLVGGVKAGLRIRDIRRQTRPGDRKVAAAIVGATLAVGLGLGLWVHHQEMSGSCARDLPDTMDAPSE
ncbi:MAG TPA: hypothetical protein VFH68_26940 [Polyangia bacterium]|jgi:hypothetical protein|nr:hypothetical protein [Polyangia bacterium]